MDVADDVERAGLVPEVVEQLLADDGRGCRSPRRRAGRGPCGSPPCARPRSERRSWSRCRRMTCGAEVAVGPRGVALDAHRSRARRARSRPGSTSCARASATSCGAASGCDVRRVDDGQPAGGEPLAGDVVQDVEGVPAGRLVVLVVGDETAAEVAGEHLERARSARRANVDLPDPDTPTSTTRDSSGIGRLRVARHASLVMRHRVVAREDSHLGRRPDLGVVGTDRQVAHGVAVRRRDARRPRRGTRRGSTRTGGRGGASPRRPGLVPHVVLDVRRGHDHRRRARAAPKTARSSAGSRDGSTCSMTSISTSGVVAGQPVVAVGQRRLEQARAGRAAGRGIRSRRSRRRGDLQRAVRHVRRRRPR